MRGSEIERFTAKYFVQDDGCWMWIGAKFMTDRSGPYGNFGRTGGRVVRAHRFSYEYFKGPIPEGAVIDHTCRKTLCVNPDHLEVVTNRENIIRGIGPTAINAGKLECNNGHELSGNNLIRHKDGRRECRACSDISKLAYYIKRQWKGRWKWRKNRESGRD
jgi:hypothetical protein